MQSAPTPALSAKRLWGYSTSLFGIGICLVGLRLVTLWEKLSVKPSDTGQSAEFVVQHPSCSDPDLEASGGRNTFRKPLLPVRHSSRARPESGEPCRCRRARRLRPSYWGPIPAPGSSTAPRETDAPLRMLAAHPETLSRRRLGSRSTDVSPTAYRRDATRRRNAFRRTDI